VIGGDDGLKRRLGLGLLTAYGVGVMVGAGIYVLIGAMVGAAGVWAPLSFVIAAGIAGLSALSYAELSSRIPEAAGAAAFVDQGLRRTWLGVAVGVAIAVAGVVSAAAVLRGGAGYLVSILDLPLSAVIVVMGAALVAVAVIGVLESLTLTAIFTGVELFGLCLVVWAGAVARPVPDWTAPAGIVWPGLGLATILAFYAFVGFEDIANMAEEAIRPERTLPRAILLSIAITAVIYAGVSLAAVRAVPHARLAESEQPLALVWVAGSGQNPAILSAIAVAAALNGVLAQIIMAARVLYGLGRRAPALAMFHQAHPRFGTPVRATLLLGTIVIVSALTLPVSALVGATSSVLLTVFALVNLSLIAMKRRAPFAAFRVPVFVPWLGLITALAALGFSLAGVGA